jgi:hypothetical protein
MHEYGWGLKEVFNHTPYQLKHLASAISKRTSLRSVSLAGIIRSAYGADQSQFQEFIDGLLDFEDKGKNDANQQFV